MKIYNLKHTRTLSLWEIIVSLVVGIIISPVLLICAYPLKKLANYCKAPKYKATKLSSDYADKTFLIAHRGFRALAPENTLPAYDKAGEVGFWGAENDIHRTKDGVWVLMHDYYTYRMMDKNYHIENTNYEALLKANIDNGSNFESYPNLKIARLEDYLEKCAKYNMVAVIELKGKRNTEYLYEVVDLVKKYGVEAQYISFNYESVRVLREHTDAKLFYLTYKIDDNAINNAKSIENCGVSFDGNDKDNQSQEAINRLLDEGLEPALWAVDDLKLVENYVDWGVKYITTNQIHY